MENRHGCQKESTEKQRNISKQDLPRFYVKVAWLSVERKLAIFMLYKTTCFQLASQCYVGRKYKEISQNEIGNDIKEDF